MPDDSTAETAPTFDEAITAAAENLRYAEQKSTPIEAADCHTRIADRWLTLASLIKL